MKFICVVLTILSVSAVFGCTRKQSNAVALSQLPAESPSPSSAQQSASSPAASLAKLVEVGEFHGDEVQARNGENWIGLYLTKTGSSMRSSTLIVRAVEDSLVDEKPGQKTGKKVDVKRTGKPLFLVDRAAGLQPGEVTTVHGGSDTGPLQLTIGTAVPLKLGNQDYLLRVTSKHGCPQDSPGCIPVDSQVTLESGQSKQVLYDLEQVLKAIMKAMEQEYRAEVNPSDQADTQAWQLIWAGDIDRDGKLDLYLTLSDHYNVLEQILFLSSRAEAGQLVKEIARFRISGC